MARSHGRILSSILLDPDFRTLSEAAQRLYLILLAQPDLNTAGVMSLNYRRWARACTSTSLEHIVEVAHELDDRQYVLLDEDTEEAFVRTLIRNDGIAKQPQMLKNALRTAEHVQSPRLRAALAAELRRLGRDDARQTADDIDPGDSPQPTPAGASDRSPIQADRSLPAGSAQPDGTQAGPCADPGGEGVGEGVTSRSVATSVPSAPRSRGSRIPDDFTVTPEMVVWAQDRAPDINGKLETERFVNYWTAKAGKEAVKLDWIATWRNWLLEEQKRFEQRRPTHLRAVSGEGRPPWLPAHYDDDGVIRDKKTGVAIER